MLVGWIFCIWVIGFGYFISLSFGATLLPHYEVEALKEVGKRLGKTDWNFGVDPCSGKSGWMTLNPNPGSENAVKCNCSFANGTVCHVISIILKAQSLPGVLPPELIKLHYLQEIDLTRNYLNGTIPPEWGSMQLMFITLLGNRLSGPIPKELGNIKTLRTLSLMYNQLSGVLPSELGNLVDIEVIYISSNNFTGELPKTLANLINLKYCFMSDNHFTGKIPDYIQNWTKLEHLALHASGLKGPIPSGISLLTKLYKLRISNINGPETPFPPLSNMLNMSKLILRDCNIIGEIPAYLGDMKSLETL